jgi:hypothetical protein
MPQDFTQPEVEAEASQYDHDVLMMWDCENDIAIEVTGTGSGYSAVVDNLADCFGTKGLKMLTRSTSAAEDDYVQALRNLPFQGDGNYSIKLRFRIPTVTIVKDFQVMFDVHDGSNNYMYKIKYDSEAHKLYYWNSDGEWTEISGYDWVTDASAVYNFHLNINTSTHKYVNIKVAGLQTSLADIACQTVDTSTKKQIMFKMMATALMSSQCRVDVDSVLIEKT